MPKISAFTIARSVVRLGYPIHQCVDGLANVADEVIIGYDPSTDDGTYDVCQELRQKYDAKLVESPWDMENRNAGTEIGRQTDIAMSACSYDWHLHCQLDEAFHEEDRDALHQLAADPGPFLGFEFQRVCFYSALNKIRKDWTIKAVRLTKKGTHTYATLDGHNCVPLVPNTPKKLITNIWMYHYQRFGDPLLISKRIRVLDGLFHPEENLPAENELQPYDFKTRNYESFALDNTTKEIEAEIYTYVGSHPKAFMALYGMEQR